MTGASRLTAWERATAGAKRTGRLQRCREHGCRWWPLDEPHDIGDQPAMTCCLICSDLQPLAKVFP